MTLIENIALKIGVNIVNFDKVYLFLCKPVQFKSKHHGYSTMGWLSAIHLSYVTVSKNPDILIRLRLKCTDNGP